MLRGNCIHKITSPVSRVRTCGLGFAHLPPSLSRLKILFSVLETQNLKLQSTQHTCGYIRLRSPASFLLKILYSMYSMLDPQNLKLRKKVLIVILILAESDDVATQGVSAGSSTPSLETFQLKCNAHSPYYTLLV